MPKVRLLWNLLAIMLTGALLWLGPFAVADRSFSGAAILITPTRVVGTVEEQIPVLSYLFNFAAFVSILLLLSIPIRWLPNKSKTWAYTSLGGLLLLASAGAGMGFYREVWAINQAALATGIDPRRLPLSNYSLSIGAYAGISYALLMLFWARLSAPNGLSWLTRIRPILVPVVALLLAIVAGGVLVQLTLPASEVSGVAAITVRLDQLTYVFQLLFGPLYQLAGILQSLQLATPLIFTGLAVALAFKAGLFNIGAAGQLTLGAIAAMLVGVYLPGPRFLVLPLAIVAAALGGAFWGAIAGWLKARFGAHEVINTIMLNYIAASLLLFLLSSNSYQIFGQNVELPFKAEGYEARSAEIRPAAQVPSLLAMLGLPGPGPGEFSLAWPLAILAGLITYVVLSKRVLAHRIGFGVGAGLLGLIIGALLPGIPVAISGALSSVRINGAFLLALAALVFYHFLLFKSYLGYEYRVLGQNAQAARYAGIPISRRTIEIMALAGMFAGLAAVHYVLGAGIDEPRLKVSLPTQVGFDGIAVALLGQNSPWGIGLAALLFGVLLAGGLQLDLRLGLSRELVTALQAMIVLFVAAGGFLPRIFSQGGEK